MRKVLLFLFIFLFFASPSFAQKIDSSKQEFFKGVVVKVLEQGQKEVAQEMVPYQLLEVEINEAKGKVVNIEYGGDSRINQEQLVKVGSEVIVSKNISGETTTYNIYDFYRLPSLLILAGLFFVLIVLIGGLRGFGSVLGMTVSLVTILVFIVPSILRGIDPLMVTIAGSIFILLTSTFLAHGVSKKTIVALIATFISLILTAIFALLAVDFALISGLGNEEFYSLQYGATAIINIKGLFLSAIIISTLGALNDITTSQSATVLELRKANPKFEAIELFRKGLNVGKEHIASLINTLVLAYAGTSFAVFIFLVLNPLNVPYWVILNNELVSDEIIMIIAGSSGLLLSVPIVTGLAALVFTRKK
jgi:uncharacterized membrane protein